MSKIFENQNQCYNGFDPDPAWCPPELCYSDVAIFCDDITEIISCMNILIYYKWRFLFHDGYVFIDFREILSNTLFKTFVTKIALKKNDQNNFFLFWNF